jgi:hypothetical protein
MSIEWIRAPDASPLLGPLYFIWYNGGDVFTWSITFGLSAGVLSCALRPHEITFGISVVSILTWLFFGMLGQGIGC